MGVLQNTKSYEPPGIGGMQPAKKLEETPQNTKGITALPGW